MPFFFNCISTPSGGGDFLLQLFNNRMFINNRLIDVKHFCLLVVSEETRNPFAVSN